MVYIGIDLGTTYCCVSVIENGKPKTIHHDDGKNIVPSVVAFGAEILVGNPALSSNIDMSNILYDSKRLIGWEFLHNLPNAETRQLWTFNVDTRDKCAGYVLNKGTPNERFLRPEEVSAEILKYLKVRAEKYLKKKVTGVVVTVPALFQDNQKAATKKAVELAGLELKRLLHEPNAAAIAYNAKNNLGDSKLLIFDFGGGTLDVSILRIIDNDANVMAVTGDTHLGGQDFDGRIMKYALTEFKTSSSYDIYQRPRLIKNLRTKCREAKEFLSNNIEETNIFMEINDEINLKVSLTKSQLNQLCSDLFTKAIQQVDSALYTAQLKKEDIDYAILVGGSTRIPRIKELLTAKFGNDKIKLDLNPDEIVSHGAAIVANTIELAIQFDRICIGNPTGATKQSKDRDKELKPKDDGNRREKELERAREENRRILEEARLENQRQQRKIEEQQRAEERRFKYEKELKKIEIPLTKLSWNINNSHKILFYYFYPTNSEGEGRICLFNSYTCSVEEIAKFHNCYWPYQVTTTQNKIFGISSSKKSFEIFDLNTRQISRGPDHPELRSAASVAYFKDKLYYLGGNTNRVDILIGGKWQTGPAFPLQIGCVRTMPCNEILYIIVPLNRNKIYRLSGDDREWTEIGEIPEGRGDFGVTSLNEKIYITGGRNGDDVLKSCLCFDPSAPVDSRISRIADMNYSKHLHSLVAANGKLYAIGGFQKLLNNWCNSIEEYDPQINKWGEVEKINLQIGEDNSFDNSLILFYYFYPTNNEGEGRICLFNSYTCSVEEIAKFYNSYWADKIVITHNKIFAINNISKSFEIFDLNIRQISRGPNPPEWRGSAFVAYYKDKLYYLGGYIPGTIRATDRVDVLIDGKWHVGPAFPLPISDAQTITCNGILYVFGGWSSNKIYRLSDDEREWVEIGELPEQRGSFGVASLNGKIYITGGHYYPNVFKSCLCFDPSAPVDSRISRISDMNYARNDHSLIVSNGKLYAIGGFQGDSTEDEDFCNSIEEYDPQTNKWREVGKINIK